MFEHFAERLEQLNVCFLVYLDYSKGFDKVPFKNLLCLFAEFCLVNGFSRLLKSYINNSRQTVSVNGSPYDAADAVSGVPQGSVI